MVSAWVVVSGAGAVVVVVAAGAVVVIGAVVVTGAVVDSVSCAPQPLNNRQTKRPHAKSFLQPFKISLLKIKKRRRFHAAAFHAKMISP